jgi:hypothetical protein
MRGLLVWLVVPLALVGCGGTEAAPTASPVRTTASPTPTSTTTTAAATTARAPQVDFVAAAEAICTRMQRNATALTGRSGNTKPTDDEMAEVVDEWRAGFDELDALDPPQDRRRDFERMLVHYRDMARAFDELIEAEDESVLAAVAASVVLGQRGSRAARDAGLDACAFFQEIKQPPPDPQDLYEATRDLVPKSARILRDAELDCVALDACRIEYELNRSIDARMRQSRALLRARGWRNIRSGKMPTGGSWIMANRNDYAVTVEFVGEKLPEHCGGHVTYGCSDGVWVHRVEVPDVLTGG